MRLIFRTLHGSHLYGTDSPNSDTDIKGVYIAPLKEVCLRQAKPTICVNTKADRHAKNSHEDIDITHKEIHSFIKDCLDGQTYAMDMLFAPPRFWQDSNEWEAGIWEDIQANRAKLLSNNVQPFIGYCRQQAGKYGLKGSRLGEVIRLRDWLDTQSPKDRKVFEVIEAFEMSEYISIVQQPNKGGDKTTPYLKVLEKMYQLNMKISNLTHSLSIWIDKYGDRSVAAMNSEGVDWKAVSHAFRCMFQVKELFTTGEIIFPLTQAPFLKEVKSGALDYPPIQDKLAELMDEVLNMSSVLPDEPDRAFWEDRIYQYYLQELRR